MFLKGNVKQEKITTGNEYLKSEEWQRKRYVVLKRDNWTCVSCSLPATEVHHKRYAKYNIGKEPIDWLVSVCKNCHEKKHDEIELSKNSTISKYLQILKNLK